MKQELPMCPYRVSGLCYHPNGCIYLPNLNCLTVNEYKERLKYIKKRKKGKKYER